MIGQEAHAFGCMVPWPRMLRMYPHLDTVHSSQNKVRGKRGEAVAFCVPQVPHMEHGPGTWGSLEAVPFLSGEKGMGVPRGEQSEAGIR